MPDPPGSGRVRALLLDIEGTTTPQDFVTRVLFPYAREHVREFLFRHAPTDHALRDDLAVLFSRSEAGDLTPSIRAYFDTTTGAKGEAESYRKIARALGHAPADVLFLSDATGELDAAREAGLATGLCERQGRAPSFPGHPMVRSFDEVLP